MTHSELLVNAFGMVMECSIPFFVGALVAGVFSGILQAATQIQDHVIGVVSRFAGVAIVISLFAVEIHGKLFEFTKSLWGNVQLYQ